MVTGDAAVSCGTAVMGVGALFEAAYAAGVPKRNAAPMRRERRRREMILFRMKSSFRKMKMRQKNTMIII